MAVFPPLSIGRSALLAQQRAIQVTSQNIANVNTPGYSRQRAVLSAVPPAGGAFGRGVDAVAVEQIVDPFLEARRLASASTLAGANARRDLLDRVQQSFPIQGPNIASALDEFFASAEALVAHPQEIAVRTELLGRAESLANRLRGSAQSLASLQREADGRLVQAASDGNAALAEIARLNRAIAAAELGGGTANDLRDTRREALGTLSGILGIQVVDRVDGMVDVFANNGTALVVGPDAARLGTEADASNLGLDGQPLSNFGVRGPGGGVIPLTVPGGSAGALVGGMVGGLIELRDTTLVANAAALDQFATALRDSVNAVQTNAAGQDLNGAVGAPLFAGTGAADLTVSLTDPRGIAAARSSNPGDNTGAIELAALADTGLGALSGATLGEFFADLESTFGNQAREAFDGAQVEQSIASSLAAQRDAISGVSLEEEFTDLIRFQRSFQAAAQVIEVSNRLLDDLIGLVS